MSKLKFEEIQVDATMYERQHELKILAKSTHVDSTGAVIPDIYVEYVNQPPHMSPAVKGNGNLSTEPIHCWSCKRDLIDNVRLNICPECNKVICTDFRCAECHCGTTWDPKLGRRVKLR